MKINKRTLLSLGVMFLGSLIAGKAHGAYLTIAPATGNFYGTGCTSRDGDGSIVSAYDNSASSGCWVELTLPIESGKTVSSITVYFYDNTQYQRMEANFFRESLSSNTSREQLASSVDTTSSSSVQYLTLSPNHVISSNYVYFLRLYATFATKIKGVKVYYY